MGSSDASPSSLSIETDQEAEGRWIAEVPELPGTLAYGPSRTEAIARAEALALRVLADRASNTVSRFRNWAASSP